MYNTEQHYGTKVDCAYIFQNAWTKRVIPWPLVRVDGHYKTVDFIIKLIKLLE